MAQRLAGTGPRELSNKWPIEYGTISLWLEDLALLRLVEPSRRKHPPAEPSEYWTLTVFGREMHSRIYDILQDRE
jgi:DNA-binding PadR family transcriptional regulator